MQLTLEHLKKLDLDKLRLYRSAALDFFNSDPVTGLRDFAFFSKTPVVPEAYQSLALSTPTNAAIAVDVLAKHVLSKDLPEQNLLMAQQILDNILERYTFARSQFTAIKGRYTSDKMKFIEPRNLTELIGYNGGAPL